MKFTTTKAPAVTADHLAGERRQFSIATNGKAFRALIDGLYENKIGSCVREIISNGYDAHAAGGVSDKPISVTAPTHLDPSFRVRDFGVSMDHETVMDVYSTIFQSTKEDTNDEIGMFGLGSKSPFAYTNTFSVVAYKDGQKRVYVAHISDDDIPQITHLVTEPSTEPQGVEVSIGVKPDDISRFHNEIRKMFHAADVPFELDGLSLKAQEVLHRGSNFVVVQGQEIGAPTGIRQGPVVYPYRTSVEGVERYGHSVIITVPIGSVEVTASRESMSMTDATTDTIEKVMRQVEQEIVRHIEEVNAQFKNRLDAYHNHTTHAWSTHKIGRSHLKLTPDRPMSMERYAKLGACSLEKILSQRKTTRMVEVRPVDSDRYLVERSGERVIRSRMRIARFWESNRHRGTVYIVDSNELPRLQRLLGIKPHQIVPVSTLPDCPPPPRPQFSGGTTSGGSRNVAPLMIRKNQFWVPKIGAKTVNIQLAPGFKAEYSEDFWERRVIANGWRNDQTSDNAWLLGQLGFKQNDIVFLTDKQAEKAGVSNSQQFAVELDKRLDQLAAKMPLQSLADTARTQRLVGEMTTDYEIRMAIHRVGVTDATLSRGIATLVREQITDLLGSLNVNPTPIQELLITRQGIVGKDLLTRTQISTIIDDVARTFNGVTVEALIENYYHNNK